MKRYFLYFEYDKKGFGDLLLIDDEDTTKMQYACRTGSIDGDGEFVNQCPAGLYLIMALDGPVATGNPAMIAPNQRGFGWLAPLYRSGEKTEFAIHPRSERLEAPGIGLIGTNAKSLFDRLIEILKNQSDIRVYVTKE